ncbi:MAG: hypothetical protein ACKOKG_00695 [Verrucomicrobiota bacterium]
MSALRDEDLIGVFDLEQSGNSDGRLSSVLRSETMDELFSWSFEKNLSPTPPEIQIGGQSVTGGKDFLSVDGRVFRLGAGEFGCLAGGMIPGAWLESDAILWDHAGGKFVVRQADRTLRFKVGDTGKIDVQVDWPSNWFSTATIRVIITGNSREEPLRGVMNGPYGFSLKWVEV